MNQAEVAVEMPRAATMSSYLVIDEYTPPAPGSPSHSRQRSLTAAIPIPSSDLKTPKRSNSIKRMTTSMRSTLSSSSTLEVKQSKIGKVKSSLSKSSLLGKDKDDKEEYNNNNGDNCCNNVGRSNTLRGTKTEHQTLLSVGLSSSPPSHNSMPMFPTAKEIDELTFTKGTSRCVLEGPVFGCPLPELLVKEARICRGDQKIYIPYLVENCVVNLLKEDVLKSEGIFRQSGRVLDNQCLKSLYDKGKYVNLEEYNDLYTVAALLKLYLRELPDPLIPLNMYSSFLSLGRVMVEGREAPITAIAEHVKSLPLANKTILKIVMALLGKVASLETENKMPPSNLAIVIGPNIMWSDKHSCPADVVNDTPAINQLAMLMITQHAALFDDDEDTLNVTLDILCQQHDSLTIKFPSFAELKQEEERSQAQPTKKKGFFERLLNHN